jgi:hypothetical protein
MQLCSCEPIPFDMALAEVDATFVFLLRATLSLRLAARCFWMR